LECDSKELLAFWDAGNLENKAKHHPLATQFFVVECRNADCNAFVVAITSEFRTYRESE